MRKVVENALHEHEEERGEITGYMLLTFQDGEAMVSGGQRGDGVAQQIISEIEAALPNSPCTCENEQDEIGRCPVHAWEPAR